MDHPLAVVPYDAVAEGTSPDHSLGILTECLEIKICQLLIGCVVGKVRSVVAPYARAHEPDCPVGAPAESSKRLGGRPDFRQVSAEIRSIESEQSAGSGHEP